MQALLDQAVNAGKPVIPVLLPDAPAKPDLPLLLRSRGWVDLRPGFSRDGIDRLVWGITGERPGAVESEGEYATETNNPLAKMLDHTDQLAPIRELLASAQSDRVIALVEACVDDWPSYLADHLHLDPWPDAPGSPTEATTLGLQPRLDDQAFWDALVAVVPGATGAPDDTARRVLVRDWLGGSGLRVLYLPVGLERHGRHLPAILRGAEAALAGLGDLAPGSQVVVLVACLRNADRPPFWWPWYARWKLSGLKGCRHLDAMRLLDKADVEVWYAGFPQALRQHYDRDRLKTELLALFEPGRPGIRYEQARRRLVYEGALGRARRRP
jgi:hypothetical protein